VEEVSGFLDHANLAVTTTYLRRLEGGGRRLAQSGGAAGVIRWGLCVIRCDWPQEVTKGPSKKTRSPA
jgi:hypothetical protein